MKRAWTYLLVLCLLLPCAADAAKARDASGVTVSGGRLWGDIVGVSGESGETALALRVDCPVPPEFTPEQLAVLTTEWIVPDETAVGEAMRATGADWSDGALKRFGPAFAAGSAAGIAGGAALIISGQTAHGVLYLGLGLICVGLTILLILCSFKCTALCVSLSKKILLKTKLYFIKRGEAK